VTSDQVQTPEWAVTRTAWVVPEATAPVVDWARETLHFAVTAVLVALTGAWVGLVWGATGPTLDLHQVVAGSSNAFRSEVAADLTFLALTAGAGLLCAAVALATRREGPGIVAGLAVGGSLAAVVADRIGYLATRDDMTHLMGSIGVSLAALEHVGINPFFKVRALGVMVAWPLVAVVAYWIAIAIRGRWHSLG
jgi:hypothetical protein